MYHYYRRDHLGNVREVMRKYAQSNGVTVQCTQYYPSGLPWAYNSGDNPGEQAYKYGGKEFVEMHGWDEYDSEARWYYPAIMRTTTMDPLAEKYYDISPYAWCGNNPVNAIDPDGRFFFVLPAIPLIIEGVVYVSTAIAAVYYGTKAIQEIKQVVDEKRTDKAKVSDTHGEREQKRRNERSLQEDVKITKNHNKMVETGAPSPKPDGSSNPKKPVQEWKVGTVVAVGVAIAKDLHNNTVKPKPTKPKPTKPQPPKVEEIKPKDRK
jgi:RHS repeat-associated protein